MPPSGDNSEAKRPLALDGLAELAYQELRAIAHRHLSAYGGFAAGDGTLDTTALVHEAYLKLAGGSPGTWRDQGTSRRASTAMRHILVDRARSRVAQRHGGGLAR
jgi:hypothetical protein